MKSLPILLAIDFDNTIARTTHYPAIAGLRKGAKKYINRLVLDGYHITIWTCRTDTGNQKDESQAVKFLNNNGVLYHEINDNHRALKIRFNNDCRKISADLYIDDKGLWLFGMPSWFWLYWMIRFKSLFIKNRMLHMCRQEHFSFNN